MKSQHSDLEKQLDPLKVASQPRKDEVYRLQELNEIIAAAEKERERLTKGSKKLKDKVMGLLYHFTGSHLLIFLSFPSFLLAGAWGLSFL